MALSLPTVDEFYAFWGDDADDEDDDRASLFIEIAANLMWMATSLDSDPTDSRLAFMVKYGIIDMALYMYITRDDIDADYSPMLSERVGSYSYSKSYSKMASAIANQEPTSVPLFDRVVAYYYQEAFNTGGGWATSTNLYPQPFKPLWLAAWEEFGVFLHGYRPFWDVDGIHQ